LVIAFAFGASTCPAGRMRGTLKSGGISPRRLP
jgi:hypothetical protein